MKTILIANAKGGSGKTTIATNLAGWFTSRHRKVALQDEDPQKSATQWLARRPKLFPKIVSLKPGSTPADAPVDIEWRVIDSPAAAKGEALKSWLKQSDFVIVPLTPSAFDMEATQNFLFDLSDKKAVREHRAIVGLVGNRIDARTQSAAELNDFLIGFDLPLLTLLRDTQVYIRCARDGLSIFDLPPSRGAQDWDQWKPMIARFM